MNKVWFDASYNRNKKEAKIGLYIESIEKDIIFKETTIKSGLSGSTQAEMFALLKAIEAVKELGFKEFTIFYGDSLSVIRNIKFGLFKNHFIYKHCYHLIDELRLEKKQFQWIERKYNKADYLTRKELKREIVKWELGYQRKELRGIFKVRSSSYILLDKAFKQYKYEVKGNGEISYEEAEKKLNRNIKRTQMKYVELEDNIIVFIYYNLLIYTKGDEIIHLYNLREDGKGYKYFKDQKEELQSYIHKKTSVVV